MVQGFSKAKVVRYSSILVDLRNAHEALLYARLYSSIAKLIIIGSQRIDAFYCSANFLTVQQRTNNLKRKSRDPNV